MRARRVEPEPVQAKLTQFPTEVPPRGLPDRTQKDTIRVSVQGRSRTACSRQTLASQMAEAQTLLQTPQ